MSLCIPTPIRFLLCLALCVSAAALLPVPTAHAAADTGCGTDSNGQCEQGCYACHDSCIPLQDLCLLEPLPGGAQSLTATDTVDLGALFTYINGGLWQWALFVSIAVAVLQVVVAGFTLATGGPDKAGEAKTKITWAIIGLLMLLLAGAILSTINPVGFTQ